MEISFSGKRALVTGAGKGIGKGIALALAKAGAVTYCISRTKSDLDSLAQEHENIRTIVQDILDWDGTYKAVNEIGPIDLLVNNAAINGIGLQTFGEITSQTIDSIMNTNLKAVINIAQVVSKGMIERKCGGAIVNISSIGSKRAIPGMSIYCCSKAAVDMATKAMAFELGPHQIRVNAVNPTQVRTPDINMADFTPTDILDNVFSRIPQNKIAELKDVVHAVLFLLSDKSDMINGAILPVDGGYWTH